MFELISQNVCLYLEKETRKLFVKHVQFVSSELVQLFVWLLCNSQMCLFCLTLNALWFAKHINGFLVLSENWCAFFIYFSTNVHLLWRRTKIKLFSIRRMYLNINFQININDTKIASYYQFTYEIGSIYL